MKLSICLASIRPHFLKQFYDSALLSCTQYPFEVIIVSPFQLPSELQGIDNIKHFIDYGSPTKCSQRAVAESSGEIMWFACDDGYCLPTALDRAIELWDCVAKKNDGMVARYCEGSGGNSPPFPIQYWNANHHLREVKFEDHWKIAPQPIMNTEYYKDIGGVDCVSYKCMSFATWSICYRVQALGGTFHLSPTEIMTCDNYLDASVDHAPIFNAHSIDHLKFVEMQNNPNQKLKIDFDNWKNTPEIWERFDKKYETYEEMLFCLNN